MYTIFLCVGGVATIIGGGNSNSQANQLNPPVAAYAEPISSPIQGTPVYQGTVIQGTVVENNPAPQNPAYEPYNFKA
jgi:hypothetical protein